MSTITTLAAVLEHPAMQQLTMLTAPARADRPVVARKLLRDVAAQPGTETDAVLLLLGDVPRTDWRLDALVSRAHNAGAAALVLPGHEPLRTPTALLAQRLGLPVLGVEDPIGAFETLGDLLDRSWAEVARIVLATVDACRRAGPDPEDVMDQMDGVLGRPLAVLDHAGWAVLGQSNLPVETRANLRDRLEERAATITQVFTIDNLPLGEVVAVRLTPGQPLWLVTVLPQPIPVEREAISAALPIIAGAIRERLAEHRLGLERDARARTSALEEITRRPATASTLVRRRALALGWDLDGWHVGVYVGVLRDLDLMTARDELIAAFDAEDLLIQAVEQADGWAVWTTTEREPSSADAVSHAEAVRRAQRRLERGGVSATYVGVGSAQVGVEGLAHSLTEARDAARLARSREETGRFLHVDRLGFGQLLLGWTRTDPFRPAAEGILEPLTKTAGDLVATLGAYLDCESSLAHTAAVLGVHRNTVGARIRKVQELLGVDLANPDERLALHLACKTLALPDPTVHND